MFFHISSERVVKKDQKWMYGAICLSAVILLNYFAVG